MGKLMSTGQHWGRLLGATLWEYYLVNLEAQQEELDDFKGNI